MYRLSIFVAALAATPAFAGMYDQPYAIVEAGAPSDVRKEATPAITKVDGKSTHNPRRTEPIPPGKHQVTLHFQSARGRFRPEFQDIELDLEACTLYRVVAVYEVKMGPDWKPKVYSEPIRDCRKKFSKAEAAAK
jgi:hypothetical protein